ncbi:MAG: protein TolR [Phycisphaeraceae bacterium]
MPSRIFHRGPTKPQMNITPLIDVVFLLIIFFMLVNNIITEQSVPMIVPQLEEPQTRELDEQGRLIVNIAPAEYAYNERLDDPLNFDGEASFIRVGLQTYKASDLDSVTAALVEAKSENPNLEVVLRSDGALYYGVVQPVMGAITRAGIDKVHLTAFMPERGVAKPTME